MAEASMRLMLLVLTLLAVILNLLLEILVATRYPRGSAILSNTRYCFYITR